MATAPEQIKGEFWLIATIVAKKGKEDDVQQAIETIGKSAKDKEAEPGTIHYITTRGVGDKSNHFVILEKYTSPEALVAHNNTEAYKSVMGQARDVIESLSTEFSEEF
ncbi:hypothetical protein DL96DRAFT_1817227 [Flagelloscypha sp. PMI_526]|nr:hypothetical protein DL96DRAFT_1817227 [Flagelloscypha sp. PMI_526]